MGDSAGTRRRSTASSIAAVDVLRQVESWPPETVVVGVLRDGEVVGSHGPSERIFRWASVTKLVTAVAVLVAAEEGAVDLDETAGPPGSTVRHLLAHASGLSFDPGPPIAQPGQRRIYSNAGFEVLAETLAEATEVQFPGLVGVLPDIGRMNPNDWGLGFELRDTKQPHWTGTRNSPRTFGHFGGSGTFLWIDPERAIACAVLTDREFDDWALDAWPKLSDDVLAEAA